MKSNKKLRPPRYIRATTNHAKLRKKWRAWLSKMKPELSDLHFKRKIFWDLQDIAKDNPAILKPGEYFDWQCRNYIVTSSVIIRKFVDQSRHKSTQSLWKLLYEALEYPGSLSRKSHLSLYRGVGRELSLGEGTFDEVVGADTEYLSIHAIKRDISYLENSTSRIYKFVNKESCSFYTTE